VPSNFFFFFSFRTVTTHRCSSRQLQNRNHFFSFPSRKTKQRPRPFFEKPHWRTIYVEMIPFLLLFPFLLKKWRPGASSLPHPNKKEGERKGFSFPQRS